MRVLISVFRPTGWIRWSWPKLSPMPDAMENIRKAKRATIGKTTENQNDAKTANAWNG